MSLARTQKKLEKGDFNIMKKSRIILLVTMLLLVASTSMAIGATVDTNARWYASPYSKTFTGDRTSVRIVGNATTCYTEIFNDYTSSCHMDALVREYHIINGVQNQTYNVGTKDVGESVSSGNLSRDYDNTSYYYVHEATCYYSAYQMNQIYDSYRYRVNQ